jgi:subtilase family serine protease
MIMGGSMRCSRSVVVGVALVVLTFVGGFVGSAGAAPAPAFTRVANVCPKPTARHAACMASNRLPRTAAKTSSAPAGLTPGDLLDAYKLTEASAFRGTGETVAIVDAYDDPTAQADLGVYRRHWGLPPCTAPNGCFRKVNEAGQQRNYPPVDSTGDWEIEESLDVDMVSAICPNCKIILVEATTNSFDDLGASVDTAVALGADVVSNSYGGGEWNGEQYNTDWTHPGVAITASSGDYGYFGDGYAAQWPATSQSVTAVGGTHLRRSGNSRGWAETAWGDGVSGDLGAGSGCSGEIAKPSWQSDTGCPRRTIADVAADADPDTGAAVYDSYPYRGTVYGWFVSGGTSQAAPIIAGVYALAGNTAAIDDASGLYAHHRFFDVRSGSNGTCASTYLCTAVSGYDGPTGLGTPNGYQAFAAASA